MNCGTLEDRVFSSTAIELVPNEVRVTESAGEVTVNLSLASPAEARVTALLTAEAVVAQDDCYHPDFQSEPMRVEWSVGVSAVSYVFRVVDDETAESDEALRLVVSDVEGATLTSTNSVQVIIEDDDRSELLDAEARFSVIPDLGSDQTEALQEALDAAAASGRGVVTLSPGSYVVSSLSLSPGTSLVGYGATLVRPANAGSTAVTLSGVHTGASDSLMTLVEGLTLDGAREQQGPFEDLEQENAHLLFLAGDAEEPGRLRASVQAVNFENGTGDGLAVGPNADVAACRLMAHNVFREGLSVHGGNTRLRVRELRATATLGTTGIWLDGFIPGYEGSRTIDVAMDDIVLSSGDFEIDIVDGSELELTSLVMGAAPFRLQAPGSTVRISDSVLHVGIPSERHNHFSSPDDVEVTDSTIVSSEAVDEEGAASSEQDRQWPMVQVIWPEPEDDGAQPALASRITFDNCRFQLAADVEGSDIVTVAASTGDGGQLVIRSSDVSGCACSWFDPAECEGCSVE